MKMPSNPEFEMCTLAVCYNDVENTELVLTQLTPEDYHEPQNKEIFTVFQEQYHKGQWIDWNYVVNRLKEKGKLDAVGGITYVRDTLLESLSAVYPERVQEWIKGLKDKTNARKLLIACDNSKRKICEGDDINEIIPELDGVIMQAHIYANPDEMAKPTVMLVNSAMARLEDCSKGKKIGYSTGFKALDYYFRIENKFYIIAARPSHGKTSLALRMAYLISKNMGKPAVFFSAESSDLDCMTRLLCMEAKIDRNYVISSDWQNNVAVAKEISDSKIIIDNAIRLTPNKLRARARKYVREGAGIVFIDYLQKMRPDKRHKESSRYDYFSDMVNDVDTLKKELDVPVVLLSQLNREVDKRDDKMPQLSDLKETGEIEQAADLVLFLMRPYNYSPSSDKDLVKVKIGKQRDGKIGVTDLRFIEEYARFEDFADEKPVEKDLPF